MCALQSRLRHRPHVTMVIIISVAACVFVGCSAIQRQLAERRDACDALCQQARHARNEGWPDQADLLLNEAVRQRPEDLETRRQLAETLWDCGRRDEALSEYRELALAHPRDVRLQQRLAVMLWTTGDAANAARVADRALRLDPVSADALLVKARYEASRRDFDAAVATYLRLARVAPDLIDAKLELAEVHIECGDPHKACALLRDVIAQPQLTPAQKGDAEWKLGLAYASADRWADAATHLSNAHSVREATSSDWQLLVAARMMAGQDSSDVPSREIQVAARQQSEPDASAWTALRDRLLVRSTLAVRADDMPNNGVFRAGFSKSAARAP